MWAKFRTHFSFHNFMSIFHKHSNLWAYPTPNHPNQFEHYDSFPSMVTIGSSKQCHEVSWIHEEPLVLVFGISENFIINYRHVNNFVYFWFCPMAPPSVSWDNILPWGTLGSLHMSLRLLSLLPQLWCP